MAFWRLCAVFLAASSAAPLVAKNVDLSTLPPRDAVQLTIYNAEDLTLVREMRRITFRKGSNPLQFSWAGTLIDPSSVQLHFPKNEHRLTLLDTTFPHDKKQMLYWNVESDFDGEAWVEVKYFTSGITWSADYNCIANTDETEIDIDGFVRIHNNSGAEYDNAQIRLVVGEINLVEAIRQLAERGFGPDPVLDQDGDGPVTRLGAIDGALEGAETYAYFRADDIADGGEGGAYHGFGGAYDGLLHQTAPKEVEKQGLGEYFIYSIEGTETIPVGWSKRIRSFDASDVPFDIEYRYRAPEYGDQLVRMFLFDNSEDNELGKTPLPDGMVRLYRANGNDSLSFLAQQHLKYVPIGDKIELNLGRDPQVIYEVVTLKSTRDNFWFKAVGIDVHRNLGGQHKIEVRDELVGWEDHTDSVMRIRNYRDKPINVELRHSYGGHVFYKGAKDVTLHDYQTVETKAECPPGKTELPFHIKRLMGTLHKQDNVTLVE